MNITMIIFVSGLEILKILTKNNLYQVGIQYEYKQPGLGRFPANCQKIPLGREDIKLFGFSFISYFQRFTYKP